MKVRLNTAADMVDRCNILADIGCDHGYLSEIVLSKGIAQRVIAADISESCLNKARDRLQHFDNAEFVVSNGFESITAPDVAVITGMGGLTVIDILKRRKNNPVLILGAHNNLPLLRKFLSDTGYKIVKEKFVYEGGKYYSIIKADEGVRILDETALELNADYQTKDEVFYSFLLNEQKKLSDYKQTDKNRLKLKFIKEAIKWQE